MGRRRKQKKRRLAARDEEEAREVDALSVLPGELVHEIMWRVPAKCMLELRSVCKWWKSLISERHFLWASIHRSYSEIHASASRAVKSLDEIQALLASVAESGELTAVIFDCIAAKLEIVKGEIQHLTRAVTLHLTFLRIFNSGR